MKVLHINKYQSGGAALCSIRICKALSEKGIESRMLFGEGNSMPEGVRGAIASPDKVFWNRNLFLRAIKKFCKLFGIWLVDVEKAYHQLQQANESQLFVHQPLSSYKNITSHPLIEWADIIHLHWVSDLSYILSSYQETYCLDTTRQISRRGRNALLLHFPPYS